MIIQKKIIKKGKVIESLPNATFKILLEDGKESLCHVAGKLRMYKIKILPGDEVEVEISPYDEKRGRIIKRK
jgi:translation initiation factor IF-1